LLPRTSPYPSWGATGSVGGGSRGSLGRARRILVPLNGTRAGKGLMCSPFRYGKGGLRDSISCRLSRIWRAVHGCTRRRARCAVCMCGRGSCGAVTSGRGFTHTLCAFCHVRWRPRLSRALTACTSANVSYGHRLTRSSHAAIAAHTRFRVALRHTREKRLVHAIDYETVLCCERASGPAGVCARLCGAEPHTFMRGVGPWYSRWAHGAM